ncbi:porin [Sulfurimonas sp.]
MKKSMIKLAVGTAAVLLMATSAEAGYTMKKKVGDVDTKLTFFGFAQLEARGGDGIINSATTDAPVEFGAQRVRLGWKYVAGKVRGKVFLDFNQAHDDLNKYTGAAMPSMVKDAFISYVFDPAFVAKAGLIKMPNGMGFTMPGWNLDIAERGMDKQLVLERNTGLMFSGRGIGWKGNKVNGFEMGHERPWKGFGYDVMVANQAARSKAVTGETRAGGLSYAVRGMFDYTEKFHMEASYAVSQNAGGYDANVSVTGNLDYSNYNVGIDSNLGKLSLKAEYFNAHNIKGTKDRDEQVFTATAGYFITPAVEGVVKHIQADANWAAGTPSTTLGNTYIGLNIFMSMPYSDFSRKAKRTRNQHKVVLNYIVASGDTSTATTPWNGLSGYKDDAFIAQYQFKF